MADIQISSIGVGELLEKLKSGAWQVPLFQRDFVWSAADVEALVSSIMEARPIGMVTLWAQPEDSGLDLENISLPDHGGPRYFSDGEPPPAQKFAILDGRQRSTAIAMAFGGLAPQDRRWKYAGRFFLSLLPEDTYSPVKFKKDKQIESEGLGAAVGALQKGYVPLELQPGEELMAKWMEYAQQLLNADIYEAGLPAADVLEGRDKALKGYLKAISDTKLAVYTVPKDYGLADICDIFETLNTTGTKVSTVDLVHAWLYAESGKSLLLRDWIETLGNLDGAFGWALRDDRPELTAQLVTACYVAEEPATRPPPRPIGGKNPPLNSVKAADLLGTPSGHWATVMGEESTQFIAEVLADFQDVVAEGRFAYKDSPYPVSAAAYLALRWHHWRNAPEWTIPQINSAYRSFFWRNALSTRYDQGFLTRIGTDIRDLKKLLSNCSGIDEPDLWCSKIDDGLSMIISRPLPDENELVDYLTNGSTAGAMRAALRLRMLARSTNDLLDPSINIGFGRGAKIELHHIFPKAWCRDNRVGKLGELIRAQDEEGRDWVGSTANFMPLSKDSNLKWRAKLPRLVLQEHSVDFATRKSDLEAVAINEEAFGLLAGPFDEELSQIGEFWKKRSHVIAADLLNQIAIQPPQ